MSEQQAEQLMQQMQMLETYFSDLSQREGTFLSILREATAAIESIKSLGTKPDSDTLVPLGMGAYVPTKISSNNKIVVNIGAGVAVEKDFPTAINYFLDALEISKNIDLDLLKNKGLDGKKLGDALKKERIKDLKEKLLSN